jgi:hypothetical protein
MEIPKEIKSKTTRKTEPEHADKKQRASKLGEKKKVKLSLFAYAMIL